MRSSSTFDKILFLIQCSEKYYTGLIANSQLKVKLTGSWETLVGQQDTFRRLIRQLSSKNNKPFLVHILEYENYDGYDTAFSLTKDSAVGLA